jgi:8-oxo-dGTP diphosphatase
MDTPISFCPLCGTAVVLTEKFRRLRPTCPNCGWIHFADPKVAAAVVLRRQGQVLLVRRVNEPFRGCWTLPAGFIDAGEDPRQAAERECLEETGLTVRATRVMDVIAGHEHERGADFIVVYEADILAGSLMPGDDADDAQWFDPQAPPPLAFRATEAILQLLQS